MSNETPSAETTTATARTSWDVRLPPTPSATPKPGTEARPHDGASPAPTRKSRAARRAVVQWIRRGAVTAAALAGVGAIVYAWLPKPIAVETAAAARGPLEVIVEEEGKTRVRDRFVVPAPISGNLRRIEREVGDVVQKGEVLARITPPDPALLDPRSRDEARARLAAALAQERAAATAVVRAAAAAEDAARAGARVHKLAQGGAVATAEVERAELAEKVARAEFDAARERRVAAAAEVRAARAAVGGRYADSRAGEAAAGLAVVASPAAGRILKLVRDSAGPVMQGAPLVEIGDPRALEVVIDVLSSDAAVVTPGMPVEIAGWGGDVLTGTVKRVEPAAFTRVSALGVEEQRVNVIVDPSDVPSSLGDGFRVEAKIVLWRGEALTVPANAVFRNRGEWAVYTSTGGRARLVRVAVGRRGRLAVEVTSGVAPGDVVIVHPGDQVSDGTRVSENRVDVPRAENGPSAGR